ncbi:MAG: Sec-independent protein translocase subunit TatA/TatB [Saprospiraceae bacterium]
MLLLEQIPELAKGVGKGIREFNRAKNSIEEDIRDGIKAEEKKTAEESK